MNDSMNTNMDILSATPWVRAMFEMCARDDCSMERDERDILLEYTHGMSEKNYNEIVTLFAMCMNHELSRQLRVIDNNAQDFATFCGELDVLAKETLDKYRATIPVLLNGLTPHEDKRILSDYLTAVAKRITKSVPFSMGPDDDSANYLGYHDIWDLYDRRNELICGRMSQLVPNSKWTICPKTPDDEDNPTLTAFTERYKIELPYMYMYAFNLYLSTDLMKYRERNKTPNSLKLPIYVRGGIHTVRKCTPHLSHPARYMVSRGNVEYETFKAIRKGWDWRKENEPEPRALCYTVSFMDLLPTVYFFDGVPVTESTGAEKEYRLGTSWCSLEQNNRDEIMRWLLSQLPLIPCLVSKAGFQSNLFFEVTSDVIASESLLAKINDELEATNAELVAAKKQLEENNALIKAKNDELEDDKKKKIELVNKCAHDWRHIDHPKIVLDIAEKLLENRGNDNITDGSNLLQAYNSHNTLKYNMELIRYTMNDSVREQFSLGFLNISDRTDVDTKTTDTNNKKTEIINIKDVFDECLSMVVFRLMMDESDESYDLDFCRDDITARIGNFNELRGKYTEKFLKTPREQRPDLLDWLRESKVFDLSVSYMSEWLDVCIKRESFTVSQLTVALVELLTNMFKYSTGIGEFRFEVNETSMDICATNLINLDPDAYCDSGGDGIPSLMSVVDKINIGSNIGKDGIRWWRSNEWFSENVDEDGKFFVIRVLLDKMLMYKK